jgi:hypothetical protein
MKSLDNWEIEHHRHYDETTHEMINSSYSVVVHTLVTHDLKKSQKITGIVVSWTPPQAPKKSCFSILRAESCKIKIVRASA